MLCVIKWLDTVIMEDTMIPQLQMGKLLGAGVFGHVFKAIDQNTKEEVAVKRIVKNGTKISREYVMYKMLEKSRHVLRLKDFFYTVNFKGSIIQNMVFELAEEDLEKTLFKLRKGQIKMSYKQIKKMIFEVVYGLSEMHKLNICHRDLKPENILIVKGVPKIADLGSAKLLTKSNSPYIVSRYYRAPELILGVREYNLSIDMWSVGVIFYEFLFGYIPFKGRTEGQQLIEIIKFVGVPSVSEITAIKKCLQFDYKPRINRLWQINKEHSLNEKVRELELDQKESKALISFFEECWSFDYINRINAIKAAELDFFDDVR